MLLLLAGCTRSNTESVDRLNEKAYAFHYRDLDSVRVYADSEKGTPIAEIAVPPTDGIDDFRTITVPVTQLTDEHTIIFELGGSSATLEFRIL